MNSLGRTAKAALLSFLLVLAFTARADAYIGPGAGFVLAPLFLGFLVFLFVFCLILFLPFIVLFRLLFGKKAVQGAKRRVVVIGLDGMDPGLAKEFMDRGKMPHFKALADEGHFGKLATSVPAISPCAWSTFMTGTEPGRHSIFDFITRDPCNYLPILSSARIEGPKRTLKLGKYEIPIGKPVLTVLRKSKPFWKVLSENRIFSSILRVPITFPPEKFKGVLLSGMCVPDLRGTQGSFSYFTTAEQEQSGTAGAEGIVTRVTEKNDLIEAEIVGPKNTMRKDGGDLTVSFTVRLDRPSGCAHLRVGKERHVLKLEEYSPWVHLEFRPGLGIKISGIVRFYITSLDPDFSMYVTPIQIDPEKPAIPISHPTAYSTYLARMHGPFATLGLAEDTWALNERIIDEDGFLRQAWLHYGEREKQLFTALETTRAGCVTIVFDTTDRIQHCFYRYLVPDHPANAGKDTEKHKGAIEETYARMDDLLGRVRKKLGDQDALFIISDHGFSSFERGVNLNTWFHENGYLALKEGAESGEWFDGIDWAKTKAYSLGLTGAFLNIEGREVSGIVKPGEEATALKREIIAKLSEELDPRDGKRIFRRILDADDIYDGPYKSEAPDLILGFDHGFRASWDSAVGKVTDEFVSDNTKSWSGDHCIDPELVPGVIFSNLRVRTEAPRLEDMAATVLDLLGVETPGYMTGVALDVVVDADVAPPTPEPEPEPVSAETES